MPFVKGHGTENDFLLLPDPDGDLDLSPCLVRVLCDRHAGIGADGVLRVVLTAAAPEAAGLAGQARWFMDYHNADGTSVEMCGNGIRVYARYLVDAGYAAAGTLPIATRDGIKAVTVPAEGDVTVDMGVPSRPALPDITVQVGEHGYVGTPISMGNPHVVVPVADLAEAGELRTAPTIAPADAFPDGTNVEFVLGRGPGRIAMRVFERGVGETRSCGTGACAAVVAAGGWWDSGALPPYDVWVAGGRLRVTRTPDGHVHLAGPAELVGEGTVRGGWLSAALARAAMEESVAGRRPGRDESIAAAPPEPGRR